MVIAKFKLLSNNAQLPVRASEGAIGYDLFSAEHVTVLPGHSMGISTDVALELVGDEFTDVYARVASRSGLALKRNVSALGGVIDHDYRGPIIVILSNHSPTACFYVSKGQRIAQLIFERYDPTVLVEQCGDNEQLSHTQRNTNGFGSTG